MITTFLDIEERLASLSQSGDPLLGKLEMFKAHPPRGLAYFRQSIDNIFAQLRRTAEP